MPATLKLPDVSELVSVALGDAFAPVKTIAFPDANAVPPQFAEVAQSVSLTEPDQVFVAAKADGVTSKTIAAAKATGFEFRHWSSADASLVFIFTVDGGLCFCANLKSTK
jgi:hypothetical protein